MKRIIIVTVGMWAVALPACGSGDSADHGTLAGQGQGAGGEAGNGAGGGAGEVHRTGKLDLLLVVDNSPSMGPKQQLLARTVPTLIGRLANPWCVDDKGHYTHKPASVSEPCPQGSHREYAPLESVHVGIVSTSLGGAGASVCLGDANASENDRAHLLERGPGGSTVATYGDLGFLNWDPGQQDAPAGEHDAEKLTDAFADLVRGAGEQGCGFEAPLEAWYRFLVDPAPYERVVRADCYGQAGACRRPEGVDHTVMTQREMFLRPDSLVAIVMFTDENDCSLQVGDQAYLMFEPAVALAPGTKACETDPYSAECETCFGYDISAECPTGSAPLPEADPFNLRCFHQKRRFGMEFLYPTSRYITALTQPVFDDGTVNPLFCSEPSADRKSCQHTMRDRSKVVLAGVVGVPWQDLARDPADLTRGYKAAAELDWQLIVGDGSEYSIPTDPLMIESVEPRTGTHPLTGEALADPSTPLGNSINGSEWPTNQADLQYACVFKLPDPINCSTSSCVCTEHNRSPLCYDEATGAYGTEQFRAQAYPGRRQLSVLKGIGDQAVVASICAANTTDGQAGDFGYLPAMQALIERLRTNLKMPSN